MSIQIGNWFGWVFFKVLIGVLCVSEGESTGEGRTFVSRHSLQEFVKSFSSLLR